MKGVSVLAADEKQSHCAFVGNRAMIPFKWRTVKSAFKATNRSTSLAKKCGFIALAGRPNAGKSTFLNHVLGEKVAIVSDKPQTTRNRILGIHHGEDLQMGFLDLPGIHKPQYKMNRMMMRAVNTGLEDADLILHFVDLSVKSGSGDRYVAEYLEKRDIPIILVLNKIDLVNKGKMVEKISQLYELFNPKEVIPISAKTGENIDKLLEIATAYLPESEFMFREDQYTDQTVRFMSAEMIREKVLHYTREEIPHSVAVTIEAFDEEEDGVYISAILWVERATQRKILLGSGGSKISRVRQAARRDLVKLMDKPIDLELYVKVQTKWRDQETFLSNRDLGFTAE